MNSLKKYLLAAALLASAVSAHAGPLIDEGFDNVSALAGWSFVNNSSPTPGAAWFQGDNTLAFSAQSGPANSYIASSFLAAPVGGFIDNILYTPYFSLATDVTLTFWARGEVIPDSGLSDSFKVLAGSTVGGIGAVAVALGETIAQGDWTQYSVLLAGQGAGALGRFGFEYFGPADSSNYFGIDTVTVTAVVPEPGTYALMAAGLAALVLRCRRRAG